MTGNSASWDVARVGDLADVEYGVTETARDSGDARFIRITDISEGGTIIDDSAKYVTLTPAMRASLLQPGDILVARTGATYGRTALFNDTYPAVFASFLIRLRFRDPSEVNPQFYLAFSRSDAYWVQARRFVAGGAQPQFNSGVIKEIVVPLPPPEEQRRIAETLGAWDEAIEKTERLIHFADVRLRGLTRRLVDARCNTWPHEHLDHVFHAVSRKAPNGTQPLSVTQDRGVVPRTEMERRIAASDQSVAAYKQMRPGDFAVSLRSFEGGLEHSEYEGGVSAAYTVLRPAQSIDARFYKYFFKSDTFVGRYLAKSVVGIRDGKQIDMAGLLITAIPLPPIDEQRRIADVLDEARREIDLLVRLKQRYELQRRGLEQRLLTPPNTQRAAS